MLPKLNRLLKDKDFNYVFKKGRSSYSPILGFKIAANNLKINRIGIIASSKVSKKATVRNKIKRQIRAILSSQINQLKPGHDIIIIAQKPIIQANFTTIQTTIINNLIKLKLYKHERAKIFSPL